VLGDQLLSLVFIKVKRLVTFFSLFTQENHITVTDIYCWFFTAVFFNGAIFSTVHNCCKSVYIHIYVLVWYIHLVCNSD